MARALIALTLCVLALPGQALAQSQSATEIVGFLMLNQAVPTADFERDRVAADAARQTITNALLVNLVSVPLGTASGGFAYRFDEALGTFRRTSDTFGPFFVERALTPGKGHPSIGVLAATSSFSQLDGKALRDGTLVTIANRFRDETTPFDTETLALRIRSSSMTLFASVPLNSRLEIGAALPLLRLSLEGSRVNVYRGNAIAQAAATVNASGAGDFAVRGKYALVSREKVGVAAAAEVRLPTGDSENLLGAGKTGYRLAGLASFEPRRLAVHLNLGLARGGISNELTFAAAALTTIGPRVTLSGELLARRVSELRSLDLLAAPHPTIRGVDTFRLAAGEGGQSTLQLVSGIKWNVVRTIVLAGHLRWSATSSGLTAAVTPALSFEYAF